MHKDLALLIFNMYMYNAWPAPDMGGGPRTSLPVCPISKLYSMNLNFTYNLDPKTIHFLDIQLEGGVGEEISISPYCKPLSRNSYS